MVLAPEHGDLTGVVSDVIGGPIAGALVTALAPGAENAVAGAFSDSEGRFALTVGRGMVEVRATAPAYSLQAMRVAAPYNGLSLKLIPASRVRGRVLEHSGAPVVGAEVVASNEYAFNAGPYVAVSNDAGEFELDQLPPGSYEILATAERWRTGPERVNVGFADVIGPVVLRAEPATTMEGVITVEGEPCERGIAHLRGPLQAARPISSDGEVRFSGLSPGRYDISIFCWPLPPSASKGAALSVVLHEPASTEDVIEIGADPVQRHWDLDYAEPLQRGVGSIRVVLEGTLRQVAMSQVRIRRGIDAALWGVRDGVATSFEDLPLDRYDVYLEQAPNVHARVSLEVDGQSIELQLAVPQETASIDGRVVGEDGMSVPDAWVTASFADKTFDEEHTAGAPVLTDEEGRFVLDDLPLGFYDVMASSAAGEGVVRRLGSGASGVELRLEFSGATRAGSR